MPAPPQRFGGWLTGHFEKGAIVEGSPFNLLKTDNVFGPHSPRPAVVADSDNFSGSDTAFAYWNLVSNRTVTEDDPLGFPDHVLNPAWCFSTESLSGSTADAGDFVPDNQGSLTRTYIPDGSELSFDTYVEISVSGTTVQAPQADIFADLYRVNIDTGAAERVVMFGNDTVTFSAGGSTERVSASTFVSEDHVFERNEVLVVAMICIVNVPNPTFGGTVTQTTRLRYNQAQGGIGGSQTVRGAFGMTLRTFTQDDAQAINPSESTKALQVSKGNDASSSASGEQSKSGLFFRAAAGKSAGNSEEVKTIIKKNFPVTATSDGLEVLKVYKKFDPAQAVVNGNVIKAVFKEKNMVSDISGNMERTAELYRAGESLAPVTGFADRLVTYIRSAESTGLGNITPRDVKICLPISSLSEEGGSGGGTTINVRPVFIFDD